MPPHSHLLSSTVKPLRRLLHNNTTWHACTPTSTVLSLSLSLHNQLQHYHTHRVTQLRRSSHHDTCIAPSYRMLTSSSLAPASLSSTMLYNNCLPHQHNPRVRYLHRHHHCCRR